MDVPELVEELPPDFSVKPEHLATVDIVESAPKSQRKIPITIVTGYLGSGKSTLLELIGRKSNKRLAIILNEFGDSAAIEKSVTIQDSDKGAVQEWLDLGNGCLCCTVKDNGVMAIENLIERSGDAIDYILLETTGVADPAPIAKMFWLDEALKSSVYIDGVVTVVDSTNIEKCLDDIGGHWHESKKQNENQSEDQNEISNSESSDLTDITTAHLQIGLADVILINKSDLSNPEQLQNVTQRIRQINASAPAYPTSYGDIELSNILDLGAFDTAPEKIAQISTTSRYHDDRIQTVCIDFPFFTEPSGFQKTEAFLQHVLWDDVVNSKPVEVHRTKGVLVCGSDVRVVQGVRETYDITEHGTLHPDVHSNKLVFIGKNLDKAELTAQLESFLNGKK